MLTKNEDGFDGTLTTENPKLNFSSQEDEETPFETTPTEQILSEDEDEEFNTTPGPLDDTRQPPTTWRGSLTENINSPKEVDKYTTEESEPASYEETDEPPESTVMVETTDLLTKFVEAHAQSKSTTP